MHGCNIMNIMTTISMAKHPRVFSFFYFFLRYHFFLLYQETPVPLHFVWKILMCRVSSIIRTWNNSIPTKDKKEERTLILNPYINLSRGVSF